LGCLETTDTFLIYSQDAHKPSAFVKDDKTIRHSFEINVFESISGIKSWTVIIVNRHWRKCYKYLSIRWIELKSKLNTVLGDLSAARNKRDRKVGSVFICSFASGNR
jgi:hypothetical protein